MPKKWKVEPFDSGDKEIIVRAGDVLLMVDYDDVDHDEAERMARFIASCQPQYERWKKANK